MNSNYLTGVTTGITTGTLGGVLASKLVAGNPYQSPKLREIYNTELAILGIATSQYVVTFNMSYESTQRWRYADWIVTTPLLLKTFYLIAVEKGFTGTIQPALIANVLMILSGYFSEFLSDQRMKMVWYSVGVLALFAVLYYVRQWSNYLQTQNVNVQRLALFFYVGWSAYGLNFLVTDEHYRQTGFNVLDLFNKGIYTFELDNVLEKL